MKGSILLLLLGIAGAYAACENACSGHGDCGVDNICSCHSDWQMGDEGSGDCSDRVCPFEKAWADSPDASGATHNYQECAGKGLCDRETGACECFVGYEGKACQRTTCPNDCSGHGTCEYLEELATDNSAVSIDAGVGPNANALSQWDSHKSRACVCDPQYTDVDCSRRQCPRGNDVMHERTDRADTRVDQAQFIALYVAGPDADTSLATDVDFNGQSFSLTFTTTIGESYTTVPLTLATAADTASMASQVEAALEGLPNNVIDDVTVVMGTMDSVGDASGTFTGYTLTITFSGDNVQGRQNLLEVEIDSCGAGCTPQLVGIDLATWGTDYNSDPNTSYVAEMVESDFNNHECGRRGKCDYDSGLCECFTGYTGLNCNKQTALV